jgi:hypothetical protein
MSTVSPPGTAPSTGPAGTREIDRKHTALTIENNRHRTGLGNCFRMTDANLTLDIKQLKPSLVYP